MEDYVLEIILAVLAIISAVVTGVLIPMFKKVVIPYYESKTTEAQRGNLAYWTKMAIEAWEKYYANNPHMGEKKKELVTEFMKRTKLDGLNDEQMSVLIDSLVDEMNKAKAKLEQQDRILESGVILTTDLPQFSTAEASSDKR